MSTNEASMPSESNPNVANASQTNRDDESLRSISKKSTEFTIQNNRIIHDIDSYYKARRYVHLELESMYDALSEIYSKVFAMQWMHFKRAGDTIFPTGTLSNLAQLQMARIYISHWILDLYCTVRECVNKLTPVAYAEKFDHNIPRSSNEYDAYLAHLNSVIRPTHIVGCYEDSLFIPTFTDAFKEGINPFDITNFMYNRASFHAIITAIKDKRSGWKTEHLSNETVGRPAWLFDWHSNDRVCSWFPRQGNYTSEDVMLAYVIGVACTPKLAHRDTDDWQPLPANMPKDRVDNDKIRRVTPRYYHGDYEVESYHLYDEKFDYNSDDDSAPPQPETLERGTKRARTSRSESDSSQPNARSSTSTDTAMLKKLEITMIQKCTYIYYARVIMNINVDDRFTTLLGLILDPKEFSVI